jgi:hypothetical protein
MKNKTMFIILGGSLLLAAAAQVAVMNNKDYLVNQLIPNMGIDNTQKARAYLYAMTTKELRIKLRETTLREPLTSIFTHNSGIVS